MVIPRGHHPPSRSQSRAVEEWDWLLLWSFAREDLRLGTDEFWALTPREYDALVQRYKQREDLANYRAGIVAAAVYNCDERRKQRTTAMQFFGEQPQARRMKSAEETLLEMERWALAMQGKPHGA